MDINHIGLTPKDFDLQYDRYQKGIHALIDEGYIAQQMIPACHRLPAPNEHCYEVLRRENIEMIGIAINLATAPIAYPDNAADIIVTEAVQSVSYRLYDEKGNCYWFNRCTREDAIDWNLFYQHYLYHQLLGKPLGFIGYVEVTPGAGDTLIELVNIT